MKTKHLIEILRCPGDDRTKCAKCSVLESCKTLAGLDLYEISAERLEVLLNELRSTQKENIELLKEVRYWEKKYKNFLNAIRENVNEQEILNGFGGD